MTGALKYFQKVKIHKTDLFIWLHWFLQDQLSGFGLKRNGGKLMEILLFMVSTIVHHFLLRARMRFLEKQKGSR
jgi:hypothetical protein